MTGADILHFIESLDDNNTNTEKYVELLYGLQRNGGPTLQTVTLIKYKRPIIHSTLKRRVQNNTGLNMLFSLTMDYEEALASLQRSE